MVIIAVVGILSLQEIGHIFFESIFGIMVLMMFICFLINFCEAHIPAGDIMNGFIPNIPNSLSFTGVIGAIIMPQNIFLHSSLVQTRKDLGFSKKIMVKAFTIETVVVLLLSFFINFTICTLFADPKYAKEDIQLENVDHYLVAFLPQASKIMWGLGLLASGLSSTASGALTGQYLMNGIFNFKVSRIKRILITR